MKKESFSHYVLFFLLISFIINPKTSNAEQFVIDQNSASTTDPTITPEMKQIIDNYPEIKQIFEECSGKQKNNHKKHISSCMSNSFSEKQKKAINAKIKELKSKNKNIKFGAVNRIKAKDVTDSSLTAMNQYLYKKLSKALQQEYGKNNSSVDHQVFYKLFDTQVGKNIIATYSNFCIEADRNNDFAISSDPQIRKAQRTTNIENLKDIKKSKIFFNNCIASIAPICEEIKRKDYTKGRACQVISQVKAARQMLIASKGIQARYDEIFKGKQAGNASFINKATTITSGELKNPDNNFAAAIKKDKRKIKSCIKDPSKAGCNSFLSNNNQKRLAIKQYDLVSENYSKKLSNMKDKDLKKYLKEAGYSAAEIDNMTNTKAKIAKLKINITNKYQSERDALKEAMAKRLDKTAVLPGSTLTKQQQKSNIFTMGVNDLNNRLEEFKQNIYFTNVVSSFLEISSGQNKTKPMLKNTFAVNQEINNSAFAKSSTFKKIQSLSSANNGVSNGQTTIAVDTINGSLLKLNY